MSVPQVAASGGPAPAAAPPVPSNAQQMAAFLQRWEALTQLSDSQYNAISKVSQLVADRPLPKELSSTADKASKPSSDILDKLLEIDSMQQFYNWFDSLEKELGEEQDERFCVFVENLKESRAGCDSMLNEIDTALRFLKDLEKSHQLVSTKTGELHQACENLVQEQQRLTLFADSVKTKLTFFEELDRTARTLSLSSLVLTDAAFLTTLKRIDDCIAFLQTHTSYRESEAFLLKFRSWQTKALRLIMSHITQTLQITAQQTMSDLKPNTPVDLSDSSIYYRKFKFAAPKVRPLVQELEARSAIIEYQNALSECMHVYFNQRRQLIAPLVQRHVRELSLSSDLQGLLRSGWSFILKLCTAEQQLCAVYFEKPSAGADALLEGFALDLADVVRPLVLQQHQIEILRKAVVILRSEVLEEQLERKPALSQALRPLVLRLQGDMQERLVFLAQAYIRDEIAGFVPTTTHLEYPERLQAKPSESTDSLVRAIGNTWYPTMQRTVVVLSKLYQTIEPPVFEGLAQEAMSVCIASLTSASKAIATKKGAIHGPLFLMRHLLILRSQISPFDVDFKMTERFLDTVKVSEALSTLISGRWGALYAMVQSPPKLVENPLDSKKELERALMTATEALLSLLIKETLEPVVSFVAKASALATATQPQTQLATQSFAQPEKVVQYFAECKKLSDEKLPPLLEVVRLYLAGQPSVDQYLASCRETLSRYFEQARVAVSKGGYADSDQVTIEKAAFEAEQAVITRLSSK